MFEFRNPGQLVDDGLELVWVEEYPGDPDIGFVPEYGFEMRLTRTETKVGYIGLRVGNTHHLVMYGGHIRYEVLPEYRGHRYAARGCRLLFPLARNHGMHTLWITCNPDIIASARTCELAGGELVEVVDLPEDTDMYQKGERRKCRYRFEL
ncbi:MAG: GNAT family N-acetyltransferase [Rubrobacter sp.]